MKLCVVLAVCVGLTYSASVGSRNNVVFHPHKEPCCMPDTWHGYIEEGISFDTPGEHGIHGTISLHGELAIDSKNKRSAGRLRMVQSATGPSNMTVIVNYAQHTMWVADPDKKTCQRTTVQGDMPPMCLPADAHYMSTARLGYGDPNSMEVDIWGATIKQESPVPMELGLTVTVTTDHCVPVQEKGGGVSNGVKVGFSTSFYDLDPVIPDPEIFTPPSYCDQAEEVSLWAAMKNPMVASFTNRLSHR